MNERIPVNGLSPAPRGAAQGAKNFAMNIRDFKASAPYLVLVLGLSFCTFLMLHRLDHAYLAPWDEVMHATVVHNLYVDCCVPKLHSVDLQTDGANLDGTRNGAHGDIVWTNSYIWLHKPLLPFYLRAALFHLTGESLFMFRLPAVLFALLTAVSLFFIAKRSSHIWVATGVALLFASNGFLFELVQGRLFSDLSEVMNVFFLTLVLGLALSSVAGRPLFFSKSDSAAAYGVASVAAGLLTALAYSCKGGLALTGLGIVSIALLWRCGWRAIRHIMVMISVFGALVLPQSLYWSHHFPQQFHAEQRHQIAHLFANIEGWGRPWDYYISVYWREVLGLPLAVSGFLAIIATLLSGLRNRSNALLVLWILSYLVPLSFGVSKIANFILPVLPAVILLVGFSCDELIRSDRRKLLYPLTGIGVILVAFYHFNLLHFRDEVTFLADRAGHHCLLLALSIGILLVSLVLISFKKLLDRVSLSSPSVAVTMLALTAFGIIVQNSRKNWAMSNLLPVDYAEQMALKATAEQLRWQLPKSAVVLVDEGGADPLAKHKTSIINAHVYFQYWSGINSLPSRQLAFAKQTLAGIHPLYVVARDPLPSATFIEKVASGYLYRVD
jgi:hypothetical protein